MTRLEILAQQEEEALTNLLKEIQLFQNCWRGDQERTQLYRDLWEYDGD